MLQNKIHNKISNSTFIILASFFIFFGCEKETELKADFNYENIDANNITFTNKSVGDYYLMTWDFGNSKIVKTSDKTENIEIYFPVVGEYEVSLTILTLSGNTI